MSEENFLFMSLIDYDGSETLLIKHRIVQRILENNNDLEWNIYCAFLFHGLIICDNGILGFKLYQHSLNLNLDLVMDFNNKCLQTGNNSFSQENIMSFTTKIFFLHSIVNLRQIFDATLYFDINNLFALSNLNLDLFRYILGKNCYYHSYIELIAGMFIIHRNENKLEVFIKQLFLNGILDMNMISKIITSIKSFINTCSDICEDSDFLQKKLASLKSIEKIKASVEQAKPKSTIRKFFKR